MTQDTYEELQAALEKLQEAFSEFDWLLRSASERTYEQWKAGGKMVSDEFVSMYPTASEAVDRCEPDGMVLHSILDLWNWVESHLPEGEPAEVNAIVRCIQWDSESPQWGRNWADYLDSLPVDLRSLLG